MSLTDLIALLIAGLTLASAGLVVFSRNAVHAAFYLLLTMLGVACSFVLLQAHFLAIFQVLVYAGIAVVLLLFILMMGFGKERLARYELSGSALVLPALLALSFALAGGIAMFHGKPLRVTSIASQTTKAAPAVPKKERDITTKKPQTFGSINAVGKHLVTHNVLAFVLLSVLLLAATIGVTVLLQPRGSDSAGNQAEAK